jgi:Ca2+-transporting ATPase
VALLWLIHYGHDIKNAKIGTALALTAFAYFRIVCTYESRSLTDSVFRLTTFDCKQINLISIGEIVLAILVVRLGVLQWLLGTTGLSFTQWLLAFVPAVALFALWELGKLIARARHHTPAVPAGSATTAQAASA